MYGIAADDFDNDGNIDILMGGNFYQSKPEVGIYDASYGTLLKGDGKGNFVTVPAQRSGINIRGAIRDIEEIKTAIANSGFDADDIPANEDSYKRLPITCKKFEDGGGHPKPKTPAPAPAEPQQ
jgi:hypothetical protein